MESQPRRVQRIIEPQTVLEGAGVTLKRSIATRTLDYVDPFLLFDHFGSDNPDDYIAGFPMHPHRGIETVTYMLAGIVQHRDSIGNAGSIGAGDVQWMTSGRGIMHEEMPQPDQGRMAGFQLWVNLPARLKMSAPRYQEIPAGRIPQIEREDGGRVRVIAGEAGGVRGPVTEIAAQPTYLDVSIPAQASFTHPIEEGHTGFAYVFEGEGTFGVTDEGGGTVVGHPRLAVFGDGSAVTVRTAAQAARFLLISGQPLHEPIARYGPFVMNTRAEIEQALRDLRDGTFIQKQAPSDSGAWYGSAAARD
jgi:redox-sensitive bicupin YhaK (pirin superfamily)